MIKCITMSCSRSYYFFHLRKSYSIHLSVTLRSKTIEKTTIASIVLDTSWFYKIRITYHTDTQWYNQILERDFTSCAIEKKVSGFRTFSRRVTTLRYTHSLSPTYITIACLPIRYYFLTKSCIMVHCLNTIDLKLLVHLSTHSCDWYIFLTNNHWACFERAK
jgi:hypothetical protein